MNLSKDSKLVRTSLWVLKNEMACYIVGIFFSILMLVGLGCWLKGLNAEPITFAFSVLTSLAFALPPAAKRFTEARPLDRMTYDELMQLILDTEKSDWKSVSDMAVEEYFFLRDTRLRIKCFNDERGIQNEDFKEHWANKFPDPSARGYWYDLYYAGERIKRVLLVGVDGNRALLPCPEIGTADVRAFDHKIAIIVNPETRDYTQYLNSAGLKLNSSR